jgi:5,10-methylenetetrahydromethanopterin reductase
VGDPAATRRPLRWGVASLIEEPMPEVTRQSARLEELGFTDIWVPDERLLRNVYVALAMIATATQHVGIGTAVTNPYTRHPAHTAAAIATIDELSGGRATLALGAGGGLDAYGIQRRNPVGVLREAITLIRALLTGEKTSYEGDFFTLKDTQIDFPVQRAVPIYLAARGPKILELAGEIADGAIIGGFASEPGIRYAKEAIARGAARAGRDPSQVETMAWLYVSAADDPRAARVAVSKMVLASLITSRPILDRIGLEIPASLRDHLDSTGWRYPTETPEEASALLPDHIVDAFAIHGTDDECRAQLSELMELGIDQLSFVLFPAAGDDKAGLAERIATKIVTPLRQRASER